ncbi:hypothetical protein NFJ02_34g86420 [Pycnococcus provasolii]
MAMMPEFYDALVSGDDAGDAGDDVSSVLVTLHSMHILSSDVLPLLGARDLAVLACVSKDIREAVAETPAWARIARSKFGVTMLETIERKWNKKCSKKVLGETHSSSSQEDLSEEQGANLAGNSLLTRKQEGLRTLAKCASTFVPTGWKWCGEDLARETHARYADEFEGAVDQRQSMALARSGHTATLFDELGIVVVVGGLGARRGGDDGPPVVVLRPATGEMSIPTVVGPSPLTRFRHAAARVYPSDVDDDVLAQLGPLTREQASAGGMLLVHGGYNFDGEFFGDVLIMWTNGEEIRWTSPLECEGEDGLAIWHHTITRVGPGRFIALGGEIMRPRSFGGNSLVRSLRSPRELRLRARIWRTLKTEVVPQPNMAIGTGFIEVEDWVGARWLHAAVHTTGSDGDANTLVVMAGFTANRSDMNGVRLRLRSTELAVMCPVVLDLATDPPTWTMPPSSSSSPQPAPRHRFGSTVYADRWWVFHGGCGSNGWRGDACVFDLHELRWRGQLHAGRDYVSHRTIAGHTLEGGVAFGGCIPTPLGIAPVAKWDVLLLCDDSAPEDGNMPSDEEEEEEEDDDDDEEDVDLDSSDLVENVVDDDDSDIDNESDDMHANDDSDEETPD